MPKIKIVPAILSAPEEKLKKFFEDIEGKADMLQVDVMDNRFVPNITPQAELLKRISTNIPLDIHLMVQEPSKEYIVGFISANPNLKINNITVHIEACKDINRQIGFIKSMNIKAGIAINPKTGLETIKKILDKADMVLCMTVEPGFSGQKFIMGVMPKIKELRKLKPELDIEVDGGINHETAKIAAKAGANVFVANSYIFNAGDRAAAIKRLKQAASEK